MRPHYVHSNKWQKKSNPFDWSTVDKNEFTMLLASGTNWFLLVFSDTGGAPVYLQP